MSEPLYLCLVYGGLAALLVALEDRRPGLLQAAGGLFGMTYLVRPEAVGYVGVSLLVVLVGAVRRSLGPLRRAWLALGGFVIAFGLVAAQGVRELGSWLHHTVVLWRARPLTGRWTSTLLQGGPAAALVLLLVSLLLPAAWAGQARAPLHYKTVGLWLRAHTPADMKVMTRQDSITLYADRGQVTLPYADWPDVLEAARVHGAGYLVVDEGELRVVRPQLAFLLEETPPELAFVRSFEGGFRRTRVYRVVGPS